MRKNVALLVALGAIIGGDFPFSTTGGAGTRRAGQNKQPRPPQWLQDRLIARAAEKRARKAARRRLERAAA